MKSIAITGGIATGKSTVAKIVKDKGYVVLDADEIGHEILKERETKFLIAQKFGLSLDNKGEIDRKTLAKIVFSDRGKLQLLNTILHPRMVKAILEKIHSFSGEEEIFVEAAVLFEMKLNEYMDYVIVTDCPDELRVKRLINRDHISKSEALARIKSQLSREEFLKRADYVIDTSKSLQHTFKQVSTVLQLKPWSDKI